MAEPSEEHKRFILLYQELNNSAPQMRDSLISGAYKVVGAILATRLGISEEQFQEMVNNEIEKTWKVFKTFPGFQ